MTSGNLSEEPIAKDNEEALRRLRGIADAFLLHDRDIYVQYDDSVVARVGGRPTILRRARGYAPFPIRLPFSSKPILACGAELKNTFCLTRDEYAFVSQHIGDLENLETLNHFQRTVELYQKLFRIQPESGGLRPPSRISLDQICPAAAREKRSGFSTISPIWPAAWRRTGRRVRRSA